MNQPLCELRRASGSVSTGMITRLGRMGTTKPEQPSARRNRPYSRCV